MKRIACRLAALVLLLVLCVSCAAPDRALSATELLELGEQYLLELDYDQALAQFLAVIEIEPMNQRGYTGAAQAYVGLGDVDRAIQVLQQGLSQLPDDADILALLHALTAEEPPETEPGELSQDGAIRLTSDSHLQVEILSRNSARISITDYNLQPSYLVRTESDGDNSGWDFYWGVDFFENAEDGVYGVHTYTPKRTFEVNRRYSVAEMIHQLSIYSEYSYLSGERYVWYASSLNGDIAFTLDGNILTWEFVIDDDEFLGDMRQMSHFVVEIQYHDDYLYESYRLQDGILTRVDFEDFEYNLDSPEGEEA